MLPSYISPATPFGKGIPPYEPNSLLVAQYRLNPVAITWPNTRSNEDATFGSLIFFRSLEKRGGQGASYILSRPYLNRRRAEFDNTARLAATTTAAPESLDGNA
jgi:hypothetical protein